MGVLFCKKGGVAFHFLKEVRDGAVGVVFYRSNKAHFLEGFCLDPLMDLIICKGGH